MILLVGALGSPARMAAAAPEQQPKPPAACRKLPAGKRVVKLNLKPNTDLGDLIAWISSVTCKQFLLAGNIGAGKTVTIYSPQLITPEEAYHLFLDALDSIGLTVYPSGRFLRIIEVDKVKTSPVPVVLPEHGR
jgi:general secretion pathway protein D